MAPGYGMPGWSGTAGGGVLQSLLNGWNPQQTSFEQLVQKMVDHDLKLVAHENR
jgi:hypothetical protein